MFDFFSLPKEKREELVRRFNEGISKENSEGCWIWNGPKDADGYGLIKIRGKGKDGKSAVIFFTRTHRFSWITYYNCAIPKGLLCMHSCDNPSCANPLHIAIGTHKQNLQECLLKDRKHKKKLAERLKIAEAVFRGLSMLEASKKFGIATSAVFRYVKSKEVVERYGNIDLLHRKRIGPSSKPLPSLI